MKTNIKKIALGLFLIIVAMGFVISALKVKPELTRRKEIAAQSKVPLRSPIDSSTNRDGSANNQSLENIVVRQQAPAVDHNSDPSINKILLESVVEQANAVYGAEERLRKEGTLWIDQKSSRVVVTLGAVQGLGPSSRLVVYDMDKKIGEVEVITPFDVISYVQPVGFSLESLNKQYYRIVIE